MLFALIGIVVGIAAGLLIPATYSAEYSIYISIAILTSTDAIFGGINAMMEDKFDTGIFLSGFIGNALLAVLLTYLGEILGVPLYYAAIFAFGIRLFQNLASIRRHIFNRLRKMKNPDAEEYRKGKNEF